ncbi:MAG: hypothetical protein BroJett005_29600 [Ignavibacteriota bacterium]|nr:MAG: hypothetical protein BroJett005_29600 [Ignavibacteriota bacterium]
MTRPVKREQCQLVRQRDDGVGLGSLALGAGRCDCLVELLAGLGRGVRNPDVSGYDARPACGRTT